MVKFKIKLNYTPSEETIVNGSGKKLRYIDLFCGIGGFHQALGSLGLGVETECVLACVQRFYPPLLPVTLQPPQWQSAQPGRTSCRLFPLPQPTP